MSRGLDDTTEQDLIEALHSPNTSPEQSITYAKMLCAKKGMTRSEWEVLFLEHETRQRLRQMGIPEDFVTRIFVCLITAIIDGINGQISHFLSFDKQGKLKCSICPGKPYGVFTITRMKPGSGIIDAIVVVSCKEHSRGILNLDGKVMDTFAEASTRQTGQHVYRDRLKLHE